MLVSVEAPVGRPRRHRRRRTRRSSAARPEMPAVALIVFSSVAALSAIAIFLVVYALGFSALQEQRSQHQLYASFRGLISPSSPIAPRIGGVILAGRADRAAQRARGRAHQHGRGRGHLLE